MPGCRSSGLRPAPSNATLVARTKGFSIKAEINRKNACVTLETAMTYGINVRSENQLRRIEAAVNRASSRFQNSSEPR